MSYRAGRYCDECWKYSIESQSAENRAGRAYREHAIACIKAGLEAARSKAS